jgi:hypothetical protein
MTTWVKYTKGKNGTVRAFEFSRFGLRWLPISVEKASQQILEGKSVIVEEERV